MSLPDEPGVDPRTGGPTGHDGPHAFVADLETPELAGEDHHHLARALRLRPGDPLTVSDGRGRWRTARFVELPEPSGPIHTVEEPIEPVTIGFTPVKGDRPEWTARRLTELGVDRIWVLQSDRSVVKWAGDRGEKQLERLTKVTREASMQSRRVWLPELELVGRAVDVMGRPGAVAADRSGRAPTRDDQTILIGPEGGWSPTELDVAAATIVLGEQVLRAETAALAAATLAVALRGRLVGG
ncbi:MAG: 16S rRNA (uracil(1498)-N(3))-methyltransferase [Actinomycetia bacterium]|nr:16S rRNA (uracil(1498)-N(3))-methyltransferase [Actinomycetes bacterium]